jgi:CHAD domain-containing protein
MSSIKWDPSKTAAENAREKLPELASEFFAAGRNANQSFAALHPFRLVTKRFRYTLEMFRPYYGPGLEQRIELLQELQQHLGEISDVTATQELLAERSDLPPDERQQLLDKLTGMVDIKLAAFRRYWQKEFSTPARERSWITYLKR